MYLHHRKQRVYKAGFATTQDAYEEAVRRLFATLDWLEDRLATNRYLFGDRLTEADWRLFTTLVRFDAVYVGHFKCNLRRIVDYPNLWDYTRELYQYPGIAPTIDFTHIKPHYYGSHASINPTRVVPVGPELDFLAPHGREGQFTLRRSPACRRYSRVAKTSFAGVSTWRSDARTCPRASSKSTVISC